MSSCLPDSVKHVNPLADVFNKTSPKILHRVWKAGGDFLDMLKAGAMHAQQAAQKINDLADEHGLAVIYTRNSEAYRFTLRQPTDQVPEGWRKIAPFLRESFLINPEINYQLNDLSRQTTALDLVKCIIGLNLKTKYREEARNNQENPETLLDRLDTTVKTLQVMIIDDSIYLITAADGLDIPDCEEVSYADFLIAQANFLREKEQAGQHCKP